MASTTAEVMLYFGEDGKGFEKAVNALRFSAEPPLETDEIIAIIRPIWDAGWQRGFADGTD